MLIYLQQPLRVWKSLCSALAVAAASALVGCADQAGNAADDASLLPVNNEAAPDKATHPIDFNRDIRPILSDKCFACHGPDANIAKDAGGFRLDTFATATVPATSGKIPIVPGDPDASELLKRVTHTNDKLKMPPPDKKLTISDAEIALLRQWIEEGAVYKGHWAFEKPVKPEIPVVANEGWARSNIDRFVAQRLEKNGLKPSKEADRATLVRRLSLDLIGLPPTPEEISDFINDKSPDAYEKLVDRLLGSPHFGERMAIDWLDAARYADTNGFHHDNIRTAWPWRQWVIEAFNSNMPYNQFVIEQLAGDLLPNATQEQILASAFCRMHNINDEGGALDDEYRVIAMNDRIETITAVFMAQTYTCSRCHDHKYDPITMDDYYSTWAYFNSIQEQGVYTNNQTVARAYPPFILWKSKELQAQINAMMPELEQARALRDKGLPKMQEQFEAWQQNLRATAKVEWDKPNPTQATSTHNETKAEVQKDQSIKFTGAPADTEDYIVTLETKATGLRVIKLDALTITDRRKTFVGRAENGNAVLTYISAKAVSLADPNQTQDVTFIDAWASHEQAEGDFDVLNALNDDKLGWGLGSANDPTPRTALFVADKPFGFEGGTKLIFTLKQQSEHKQHALAAVRINLGACSDQGVQAIRATFPRNTKDLSHPLQPIALIPSEILPDGLYDKSVISWREKFAPEQDQAMKSVEAFESKLKELEDQAVPVLVMKELDQPLPAYVLNRGEYTQPITERLRERRPPLYLDVAMPQDAPNNRLGYAMWLTQPEHPLTARVQVNRIWQMIFGTGLVKTAEDFGSQAEWPSHMELLDYLAVSFVESGWDMKALIRQIVTSATYRQQAVTQIASLEIDQPNRLLSYFPRRRLAGELIRDQALYVAGLMNDEIGGPSVKPYQPGDLWSEVSMGNSNTARFSRDKGQALYRRSMYTFWKRTSPPAQMQTFNAPTREFCVIQRDLTNTPLQALVLWNDEQFLEAARALAQRSLTEVQGDDARLSLIYRRCTGGLADDRVLSVLRETLAYYRDRYGKLPDDATALLAQGEHPLPQTYDPAELASWMMICNAVLSLDETIVRD